MPDEKTSPEVAKAAGKILRDKNVSPEIRKVAASALNQAPDKKKYVATKGIDFGSDEDAIHCDVGDPLPAGVTKAQIKDLLEIGAIKEK